MKKNIFLVGIMFTLALALTGCYTMGVSLSDSTRPITSNDTVTEIGPASGSAWTIAPLGLPIGEPKQVGNALSRALSSSGGDALIEPKVDYQQINLGIVMLMRTHVYGIAVKIKKGGAVR